MKILKCSINTGRKIYKGSGGISKKACPTTVRGSGFLFPRSGQRYLK
jgi:hypothetical protein